MINYKPRTFSELDTSSRSTFAYPISILSMFLQLTSTKQKLLLILIVLLSLFPSIMSAQWILMKSDADKLVQTGARQVYNLQFDSASANFRKVIELYPNHPAGYFLDAMVGWWKIQTNPRSEAFDNDFLAKAEKTIEVSDKLLEDNTNDIVGLFFKGGALGYRGRFYASREMWIKAASDGKTALDILTRCQKLAPNNHDIMLGTGIYNYYAAVLPERYPLLKTVMYFLPPGDKQLGILQLKAAGKSARYAATEAKSVLLQVYYQFEQDPANALPLAQELHSQFPDNAYFHRYLGRCQVQLGMSSDYEATWRDILKKCIFGKLSYDKLTAREALYYVGLAIMNKGMYDLALKYFYKCDEGNRFLDSDETGFLVMVNLKIGNIYDIQGKRDLAITQYNKVLGWGDRQNSHELAKQYIAKPYGK